MEQTFTSQLVSMARDIESCKKNSSYSLGHMPRAGGEEEWFTKRRRGEGAQTGPLGYLCEPGSHPNFCFSIAV